jgi:hypothetical protein
LTNGLQSINADPTDLETPYRLLMARHTDSSPAM